MNRSKACLAPRHIAVAAAAAILAATLPAAANWPVAHGLPSNIGFVNIRTAPAGAGSLTVPGLGTFAAGAGPVIAPDGTVVLGTLEGRVIGLRADGKPYWSRSLQPGSSVMSSPAIGADGMVYVIGAELNGDARTTRRGNRLDLYRFTTSGAQVGPPIAFPTYGGVGFTSAFPNIWRTGATEAVMVPVLYNQPGTAVYKVHLIAFSPAGSIIGDTEVSTFVPQTTGSAGCIVSCFSAPQQTGDPAFALPKDTMPPMPGVAVYTFPGGGTPWVIVADGFNDVVGYTFYPAEFRFRENFRVHDPSRRMVAPPVMTPASNSVIGTDKGLIFAGPSGAKLPPIDFASVYPPPAMVKGRLVTVQYFDVRSIRPDGPQDQWRIQHDGRSIVSAAASPDYVYVSRANGLYTYRMQPNGKLDEVSRVDWLGGGASPPAIGPDGRVYAIASNILFIFPPPTSVTMPLKQVAGLDTGKAPATGGTKVTTAQPLAQLQTQGTAVQPQGKTVTLLQPQAQEAPKPATQTFAPPLTASGKRLYACQDFAGHGCGAPVAGSFCQQQGFAKAGKIDTQTEKVQAETLAGQLCDKKKCKVFKTIVCLN